MLFLLFAICFAAVPVALGILFTAYFAKGYGKPMLKLGGLMLLAGLLGGYGLLAANTEVQNHMEHFMGSYFWACYYGALFGVLLLVFGLLIKKYRRGLLIVGAIICIGTLLGIVQAFTAYALVFPASM